MNLGFARDNLPRIEDGAFVINLDGKQSEGTHWVSLFIDKNSAFCFDMVCAKSKIIP